jgi:hypothetical protein
LDAFYVCAAKRYYQFLTGVSVNVEDIGAPGASQPTSAQMTQRDLVISLGRKLKQDQSVQNLIYRIIDSDAFKNIGTLKESP